MLFSRIFGGGWSEPRYIRRMRVYLQQARMAELEHSIAAEYYQASADMYAARARRLEQDLHAWDEQALRRHSASKGMVPARPEPAAAVPTAAVPAAVGSTPSVVRAA